VKRTGTRPVAVLLVGLLLAAVCSASGSGGVAKADSATASSAKRAPALRPAMRARINAAIDRGLAQTGTGALHSAFGGPAEAPT
jgi:hypothetical protein